MSNRLSLRHWVTLACAGVVFGASSQAHAFEPFTVEEIRVEGLQRINAGTVFNYLPVKKGDRMDDSVSNDAIRALAKTGFFKDVVLEREGNTLVVFVSERPAIASVEIEGNVDIQKEPLQQSLNAIGLTEGRVFDRALLDQVEQELKRQYLALGDYAAQVKITVTPLERNRVAIKINVAEGEKATIRSLKIIGNKAFDEATLKERFELGVKPALSFFYSGDQYAKQKLSADLERLRSFYLDRGYINFNIESTQVAITPDKQQIYVTININEGEQFRVSEVKISGDTILPEDELRKLISLEPGQIFSRRELAESSTRISDRLGNVGYAFANVNPLPDVDEAKREVKLTFFVDPGKRVYVRRINVSGNARTNEEVLRREIRQMEGAPLETTKIERSRTRINRLSYFDSVNVDTKPVPGAPDLADVAFDVVERDTFGSFNAGIGYGDVNGFQLTASIVEENFLGSGERYSLNFNNSATATEYSFSFTNPYYTLDGVSRSWNVFYRTTDPDQASSVSADYTLDSYGVGLNFGVPLSEFNTLGYGLEGEHTLVKTTASTTESVVKFCTDEASFDNCQFDAVKANAKWTFDSRDRVLFPTTGTLHSVGGQVALPIGGQNVEFYKLTYDYKRYTSVDRKGQYVFQLKGGVAYGESYGATKDLPPFEKYYAGGARTLRGYVASSLGPQDSTGGTIGGNARVLGNAELVLRSPGSESSDSMRFGFFIDAGNVFGNLRDVSAGEIRFTGGAALYWITPVGPLSFSVAQPLNKKSGDETEVFQFTLGAAF